MKRNVQILHLASGVELVAEVINQNFEGNVGVKSPFCIYVHVDSLTQEQRIKVSPWSIATWKADADKVYWLNKSLILMMSAPPAEIEAMYIKNTTGLSIPTQAEKNLICG